MSVDILHGTPAKLHVPPTDSHPSSEQALLSTLTASSHAFLQPSPALHTAALVLAKRFLDPLASGISELQQQRQQQARKKRKRGQDGSRDDKALHIKRLHVEGFGIDQIWEQARRVLDASREEAGRNQPHATSPNEGNGDGKGSDKGIKGMQAGVKMVRFGTDGFEVGSSDEESNEESDENMRDEGDDLPAEEDLEDDLDGDGLERGADAELEEDDDNDGFDMDGNDLEDGALEEEEEPVETFVSDPHGLNDGFFSIDEFNKRSAFLEQQDAQGLPDPDAASDEEHIDWDVDPLQAHPQSGKKLVMKDMDDLGDAEDTEGDNDDDDEEGPTFGDADLNDPQGEDEEDMDDITGLEGMQDTNQVFYADFFAPPARKADKNTKQRSKRAAISASGTAPDRVEDDIQGTISAVHRDLFEDDDDLAEEAEDRLSPADVADPRARRSTHERRQAQIAEQIRRVEAANVAKREWTLAGEARAVDRPMNSLLEEDLDFERAGKPVPVITAEVTESIEDLIKRRILAKEFDEVLRRRPDNLVTGNPARRGLGKFELDDTKSREGLAELYEQEHLRKTDPSYVDVRDEKLKKEHQEIERMWKDVSATLDALSSWHYKPKPSAPVMEIRADVPTVSLEDARPSAGGDMAGSASQLAPQEIYRPGENGKDDKARGELVTKGGIPLSKDELTRDEKTRRRRREKERMRKAGINVDNGKKKENKKTKDRNEVVGNLKKGGVKVIGRKGEILDVEGKAVKNHGPKTGGGRYKL